MKEVFKLQYLEIYELRLTVMYSFTCVITLPKYSFFFLKSNGY